MNKHLQEILHLVQGLDTLPADQKAAVLKSLKEADKEFEITLFKLDRTEKVKRTTAILLEETIEELEQKRKAVEAQNKELEIEAALERVRARTISMQKSDELSETAVILFHQLTALGLDLKGCGFNIWEKGDDICTAWMSGPNGQLSTPFRLPLTEDPFFIRYAESKNNGEDFWVYETGREELAARYHYLRTLPGLGEQIAKEQENGTEPELPPFVFDHVVNFANGNLIFVTNKPHPEAWDIFRRFGKVFQQTYTRFLDLQKSEQQAREATIEVALEKVRSKAMGMHNSTDISVTASMVFTELRKLGINPIRSGVGLLNKDSRKAQLYSATSSASGDSLSLVGWIMLTKHPVAVKIYDSWMTGEDYYPVLSGEQLKTYYENLLPGLSLPSLPDWETGQKQYGHFITFSAGCLYAWSDIPYNETEIKILKRFAAIIDLTFRRYFELQKSEASAKEAIRQASLDRVRAEIASMRTTGDLDRITPLIWNELTILGIPFIRCGVFIMNDAQQLIHTFLSTPDGKAIAAFHIPYATPGHIADVLHHWKIQQNYAAHWNEADFREFAGTLVKQGALSSSEQYLLTIPQSGFHLHFLPFIQGMLYVGNIRELNSDEIKLVQSVADAFATAYARYEDFNKLESAKKQVDSTLAELQATQKQLIQSEKMASLGELTAGIAHEIQNPLNFVNNFSEVSRELLDELKNQKSILKDAQIDELLNDIDINLEKINHHGKRADAIVKGMLQHSRSTGSAKEPTDINVLADEYLRLAYHGLRAKDKGFNATLKTDYDETIGNIKIIPQDIGRVILNLITNAFYAVNEKKKEADKELPTLEKLATPYLPTVAVSTKRIADNVEIRVSDNGIGIPQKIVDKIFQPFFTTKPTGSGTGLGLSLAYDIVKAHGGEIKVETTEGNGSEFIIRLPVNKAS